MDWGQPMRKRMIIMIAALAVVFGGVFGYKGFIAYMTAQALADREPPPVTVGAVYPDVTDWQETLRLTGELRAARQVKVSPEVSGIVREIAFESGARVKEGELLVALDTETDEAELAALQATARLAELTLKRARELRAQNLNSPAELDQAEAEHARAQARVEAQRTLIAEKTIRAPFAGRLGIRRVDPGQYLDPGTGIVTLQQLDPIYVDFDVPQHRVADVEPGRDITLRVGGYDETFQGTIEAVSPVLEKETRSFAVRARLDNAAERLRPGMYGTVLLDIGEPQPFVTLRQTAIAYRPYGDAVWVVDEREDGGLVARQRNVRTGRSRGDQVQILSGVDEGDRVVVIGHHKLRPGARVRIDNNRLPPNEAEPQNVENR